jgi:hypothetical protein
MNKRMIIIYSKPLRLGAQEKDSINGVKLFSNIVENIIEVIIDLSTQQIDFKDTKLQLLGNKSSYKNSIE